MSDFGQWFVQIDMPGHTCPYPGIHDGTTTKAECKGCQFDARYWVLASHAVEQRTGDETV